MLVLLVLRQRTKLTLARIARRGRLRYYPRRDCGVNDPGQSEGSPSGRFAVPKVVLDRYISELQAQLATVHSTIISPLFRLAFEVQI